MNFDFINCKLNDVYFSAGELTDLKFDNSQLQDVWFSGSLLDNVKIKNSTLENRRFDGAEAYKETYRNWANLTCSVKSITKDFTLREGKTPPILNIFAKFGSNFIIFPT